MKILRAVILLTIFGGAICRAEEQAITLEAMRGGGASPKVLTLVYKQEKGLRLLDGSVRLGGGKAAVEFRGFYASGAKTSSGQVMRFDFQDTFGNRGTADLTREEDAWSIDFDVTKVANPSSVSLYEDGPLMKK